ncbi:hypothetical protein BB559_003588 [Furculomyces boomerangus]|uniref:Uncharacterized protein n=2 Tax=Harpellales TaxID=61421 RepID=A0A2T9YKD1_9FUNG|nr:hypothetical protein BB559_003588 [Furculomyces boomerangus]PWA03022.1 hypothetical protein BB558_000810 [Smittium angustum]
MSNYTQLFNVDSDNIPDSSLKDILEQANTYISSYKNTLRSEDEKLDILYEQKQASDQYSSLIQTAIYDYEKYSSSLENMQDSLDSTNVTKTIEAINQTYLNLTSFVKDNIQPTISKQDIKFDNVTQMLLNITNTLGSISARVDKVESINPSSQKQRGNSAILTQIKNINNKIENIIHLLSYVITTVNIKEHWNKKLFQKSSFNIGPHNIQNCSTSNNTKISESRGFINSINDTQNIQNSCENNFETKYVISNSKANSPASNKNESSILIEDNSQTPLPNKRTRSRRSWDLWKSLSNTELINIDESNENSYVQIPEKIKPRLQNDKKNKKPTKKSKPNTFQINPSVYVLVNPDTQSSKIPIYIKDSNKNEMVYKTENEHLSINQSQAPITAKRKIKPRTTSAKKRTVKIL